MLQRCLVHPPLLQFFSKTETQNSAGGSSFVPTALDLTLTRTPTLLLRGSELIQVTRPTDNWQRCPACVCVGEYFVEPSASSPHSRKLAGPIGLCPRGRVCRSQLCLQGLVTRLLRRCAAVLVAVGHQGSAQEVEEEAATGSEPEMQNFTVDPVSAASLSQRFSSEKCQVVVETTKPLFFFF